MVARESLGQSGGRRETGPRITEGGNYFTSDKGHLKFFSSGCRLLDCALGGGWVVSRVSNVIGDKSTGKTLLAIEASANFARRFKKAEVFYREPEAAFDEPYAGALGMPLNRVDFSRPHTVEDVFVDMEKCLAKVEAKGIEAFYILDSLDALSDTAELERDFGDKSYGTGKAKDMSQLFRRIVRRVESSNMALMIISQIRDKIGVTFGDKTTRAGGHALDFYASHVIMLSHLKRLTRTIRGVTRADGIRIKAHVKKNKIGLPFREAEFDIKFGYGIDDLAACVDWLDSVKRVPDLGLNMSAVQILKAADRMDDDAEYFDWVKRVADGTEAVWRDIETSFMPTRRKY